MSGAHLPSSQLPDRPADLVGERKLADVFNGGRTFLDVGNTQVLVGMITERVACEVYRIEASDSYPQDYDATVGRSAPRLRKPRFRTGTEPLTVLGR